MHTLLPICPPKFFYANISSIDDPRTPLVLILFAAETVLTTLTCIADYTSWENVTIEVKRGLAGLYLPYLGLGM